MRGEARLILNEQALTSYYEENEATLRVIVVSVLGKVTEISILHAIIS